MKNKVERRCSQENDAPHHVMNDNCKRNFGKFKGTDFH